MKNGCRCEECHRVQKRFAGLYMEPRVEDDSCTKVAAADYFGIVLRGVYGGGRRICSLFFALVMCLLLIDITFYRPARFYYRCFLPEALIILNRLSRMLIAAVSPRSSRLYDYTSCIPMV